MKISVYILLFFTLLLVASFKPNHFTNSENWIVLKNNQANISDTFPIPTENKNMVFYVQRTHNINTIVYELNYNKDSTLNENSPLHPYWIRYADKGETKELSYIQKEYAYGLVSKIMDKEKQTFKINFVSYKKKDIFLIRSKADGKYHAFININGKLARLEKIFAKIDGGTFWVPHITYVEITGKDLSGKIVSEKIIP